MKDFTNSYEFKDPRGNPFYFMRREGGLIRHIPKSWNTRVFRPIGAFFWLCDSVSLYCKKKSFHSLFSLESGEVAALSEKEWEVFSDQIQDLQSRVADPKAKVSPEMRDRISKIKNILFPKEGLFTYSCFQDQQIEYFLAQEEWDKSNGDIKPYLRNISLEKIVTPLKRLEKLLKSMLELPSLSRRDLPLLQTILTDKALAKAIQASGAQTISDVEKLLSDLPGSKFLRESTNPANDGEEGKKLLLQLAAQQGDIKKLESFAHRKDLKLSGALGKSVLLEAIKFGQLDFALDMVYLHGLSFKGRYQSFSGKFQTPLEIAIQEGHTELVWHLVEVEGCALNKLDAKQSLTLYKGAVDSKHRKMLVKWLSAKGVDINAWDDEKSNIIHYAKEQGLLGMIPFLQEEKEKFSKLYEPKNEEGKYFYFSQKEGRLTRHVPNSWSSRIVRAIGSSLGLCDSLAKSCVKRSLQALSELDKKDPIDLREEEWDGFYRIMNKNQLEKLYPKNKAAVEKILTAKELLSSPLEKDAIKIAKAYEAFQKKQFSLFLENEEWNLEVDIYPYLKGVLLKEIVTPLKLVEGPLSEIVSWPGGGNKEKLIRMLLTDRNFVDALKKGGRLKASSERAAFFQRLMECLDKEAVEKEFIPYMLHLRPEEDKGFSHQTITKDTVEDELKTAAEYGDLAFIEKWGEKFQKHFSGNLGKALLLTAIKSGQKEFVLEFLAKHNLSLKGSYQSFAKVWQTPMDVALECMNVELIHHLVTEEGYKFPNIATEKEAFMLYCSAINSPYKEKLISWLMANHVDIRAEFEGKSAIHYAKELGLVKLTAFLEKKTGEYAGEAKFQNSQGRYFYLTSDKGHLIHRFPGFWEIGAWRRVGATLGFCDSVEVYCAKKSLQNLQEESAKNAILLSKEQKREFVAITSSAQVEKLYPKNPEIAHNIQSIREKIQKSLSSPLSKEIEDLLDREECYYTNEIRPYLALVSLQDVVTPLRLVEGVIYRLVKENYSPSLGTFTEAEKTKAIKGLLTDRNLVNALRKSHYLCVDDPDYSKAISCLLHYAGSLASCDHTDEALQKQFGLYVALGGVLDDDIDKIGKEEKRLSHKEYLIEASHLGRIDWIKNYLRRYRLSIKEGSLGGEMLKKAIQAGHISLVKNLVATHGVLVQKSHVEEVIKCGHTEMLHYFITDRGYDCSTLGSKNPFAKSGELEDKAALIQGALHSAHRDELLKWLCNSYFDFPSQALAIIDLEKSTKGYLYLDPKNNKCNAYTYAVALGLSTALDTIQNLTQAKGDSLAIVQRALLNVQDVVAAGGFGYECIIQSNFVFLDAALQQSLIQKMENSVQSRLLESAFRKNNFDFCHLVIANHNILGVDLTRFALAAFTASNLEFFSTLCSLANKDPQESKIRYYSRVIKTVFSFHYPQSEQFQEEILHCIANGTIEEEAICLLKDVVMEGNFDASLCSLIMSRLSKKVDVIGLAKSAFECGKLTLFSNLCALVSREKMEEKSSYYSRVIETVFSSPSPQAAAFQNAIMDALKRGDLKNLPLEESSLSLLEAAIERDLCDPVILNLPSKINLIRIGKGSISSSNQVAFFRLWALVDEKGGVEEKRSYYKAMVEYIFSPSSLVDQGFQEICLCQIEQGYCKEIPLSEEIIRAILRYVMISNSDAFSWSYRIGKVLTSTNWDLNIAAEDTVRRIVSFPQEKGSLYKYVEGTLLSRLHFLEKKGDNYVLFAVDGIDAENWKGFCQFALNCAKKQTKENFPTSQLIHFAIKRRDAILLSAILKRDDCRIHDNFFTKILDMIITREWLEGVASFEDLDSDRRAIAQEKVLMGASFAFLSLVLAHEKVILREAPLEKLLSLTIEKMDLPSFMLMIIYIKKLQSRGERKTAQDLLNRVMAPFANLFTLPAIDRFNIIQKILENLPMGMSFPLVHRYGSKKQLDALIEQNIENFSHLFQGFTEERALFLQAIAEKKQLQRLDLHALSYAELEKLLRISILYKNVSFIEKALLWDKLYEEKDGKIGLDHLFSVTQSMVRDRDLKQIPALQQVYDNVLLLVREKTVSYANCERLIQWCALRENRREDLSIVDEIFSEKSFFAKGGAERRVLSLVMSYIAKHQKSLPTAYDQMCLEGKRRWDQVKSKIDSPFTAEDLPLISHLVEMPFFKEETEDAFSLILHLPDAIYSIFEKPNVASLLSKEQKKWLWMQVEQEIMKIGIGNSHKKALKKIIEALTNDPEIATWMPDEEQKRILISGCIPNREKIALSFLRREGFIESLQEEELLQAMQHQKQEEILPLFVVLKEAQALIENSQYQEIYDGIMNGSLEKKAEIFFVRWLILEDKKEEVFSLLKHLPIEKKLMVLRAIFFAKKLEWVNDLILSEGFFTWIKQETLGKLLESCAGYKLSCQAILSILNKAHRDFSQHEIKQLIHYACSGGVSLEESEKIFAVMLATDKLFPECLQMILNHAITRKDLAAIAALEKRGDFSDFALSIQKERIVLLKAEKSEKEWVDSLIRAEDPLIIDDILDRILDSNIGSFYKNLYSAFLKEAYAKLSTAEVYAAYRGFFEYLLSHAIRKKSLVRIEACIHEMSLSVSQQFLGESLLGYCQQIQNYMEQGSDFRLLSNFYQLVANNPSLEFQEIGRKILGNAIQTSDVDLVVFCLDEAVWDNYQISIIEKKALTAQILLHQKTDPIILEKIIDAVIKNADIELFTACFHNPNDKIVQFFIEHFNTLFKEEYLPKFFQCPEFISRVIGYSDLNKGAIKGEEKLAIARYAIKTRNIAVLQSMEKCVSYRAFLKSNPFMYAQVIFILALEEDAATMNAMLGSLNWTNETVCNGIKESLKVLFEMSPQKSSACIKKFSGYAKFFHNRKELCNVLDLFMIEACWNGDKDLFFTVLSHQGKSVSGFYELLTNFEVSKTEMKELFLEAIQRQLLDKNGVLVHAIQRGWFEFATELLDNHGCDKNALKSCAAFYYNTSFLWKKSACYLETALFLAKYLDSIQSPVIKLQVAVASFCAEKETISSKVLAQCEEVIKSSLSRDFIEGSESFLPIIYDAMLAHQKMKAVVVEKKTFLDIVGDWITLQRTGLSDQAEVNKHIALAAAFADNKELLRRKVVEKCREGSLEFDEALLSLGGTDLLLCSALGGSEEVFTYLREEGFFTPSSLFSRTYYTNPELFLVDQAKGLVDIFSCAAFGGSQNILTQLVELTHTSWEILARNQIEVRGKEQRLIGVNPYLYAAIEAEHENLLRWLIREKKIEGASTKEAIFAFGLFPEKERFILKKLLKPFQKYDVPKSYMTVKSLESPFLTSKVPEPNPKNAWEELKEISEVEGKRMIKRGVNGIKDLYDRIYTKRKLAGQDKNHYLDMKKYVGHLLLAAKKNPEIKEEIYDVFADMVGRCGGTLEDLALAYQKYCLHLTATNHDLSNVIKSMQHEIVMGALMFHVQKFYGDVHNALRFRKIAAPMLRLLLPEQEDSHGISPSLESVYLLLQDIMSTYPDRLVEAIMSHIEKPMVPIGNRSLEGDFTALSELGEIVAKDPLFAQLTGKDRIAVQKIGKEIALLYNLDSVFWKKTWPLRNTEGEETGQEIERKVEKKRACEVLKKLQTQETLTSLLHPYIAIEEDLWDFSIEVEKVQKIKIVFEAIKRVQQSIFADAELKIGEGTESFVKALFKDMCRTKTSLSRKLFQEPIFQKIREIMAGEEEDWDRDWYERFGMLIEKTQVEEAFQIPCKEEIYEAIYGSDIKDLQKNPDRIRALIQSLRPDIILSKEEITESFTEEYAEISDFMKEIQDLMRWALVKKRLELYNPHFDLPDEAVSQALPANIKDLLVDREAMKNLITQFSANTTLSDEEVSQAFENCQDKKEIAHEINRLIKTESYTTNIYRSALLYPILQDPKVSCIAVSRYLMDKGILKERLV
jgi:hypothetical protein